MTAASRGLYRRSRGAKPARQFVSDYEVIGIRSGDEQFMLVSRGVALRDMEVTLVNRSVQDQMLAEQSGGAKANRKGCSRDLRRLIACPDTNYALSSFPAKEER